VPANYKLLEKLTFLYEGAPTSVYAIKMFSYTMQAFKHLPIDVLSVRGLGSTLHVPDNKLMNEFMKRHYPKAVYTILKGLPEEEIVKHLKSERERSLTVLGAYRRGAVSRWFRQSMADVLIKETKLPLFIAHNK
jgi:hypothetical protein